MRVHFTLNGAPRALEVDPLERALDVIRRLGLTGTKEGCGEGECGSCTIMMNGRPVNSCLVIASQLDGSKVGTVEGLAADLALSPLQQAFIERGATQCGICTPGILIAAEYLLGEARRARAAAGPGAAAARFDAIAAWASAASGTPTAGALDAAIDRDIRTALAGNICRCTGYDAIVRAVKDALALTVRQDV
jgi:aerobic carbon-monoxide dehydrogenase small subunit